MLGLLLSRFIVFSTLYILPFFLIYSIIKDKLNSIPSRFLDTFAVIVCLLILIAEHFRPPKIPNLKPLLILPNTKRLKLRKVLHLLISDISKWFLFLPFVAGLHAVYILTADYFGGIIITIALTLIYFAIVISSWITGIVIRFGKSEGSKYKLILPSFLNFLGLLILMIIPYISISRFRYVNYIIFSVLLFFVTYSVLRKNIDWLVEMVFEPLNYNTKYRKYKINVKINNKIYIPLFLQKEIRMCFRSRRIRVLFFMVPIYALAVSIGLFLKGNVQGLALIPYFATTTLAINYNEYWEKYWAWDRKSHGLIFSTPEGKKQYFVHKTSYLFIVASTVLPVHILFFRDNVFMGIIGGLIFMGVVSVFTGYDSMNNRSINADLNASIWTKMTFNIHFVFSLIMIATANWYLLFKAQHLFLQVSYVFATLFLIVFIAKRLYLQFQSKEWAYGH